MQVSNGDGCRGVATGQLSLPSLRVGIWVPASAGKAKGGIVHSVSGWTRGVQVKLWDPLRTHAIPERLTGVNRVITTRRYANPRLSYLTSRLFCIFRTFMCEIVKLSVRTRQSIQHSGALPWPSPGSALDPHGCCASRLPSSPTDNFWICPGCCVVAQ